MPAERVRRVHFLFGVITVRSNGALCSRAGNRLVGVVESLKAVMDAWPMSSTPLRTMLISRNVTHLFAGQSAPAQR